MNRTLKNLSIVANYIFSEMESEARRIIFDEAEIDKFLENLKTFFNQLLDPSNGTNANIFKIKANRQLLCSIGIDLKSGNVPAEDYFKIFLRMDFERLHIEPRQLFYLSASNYHFTNSFRATTRNFKIMVCPLKDWKYYIDPTNFGLFGADQAEFSANDFARRINSQQNMRLKTNLLYKGSERSYFWLCTKQEFENICKAPDPQKVIDALGLSHFNYEDEWTKHFFYIDFSAIRIETFKPNATMINWADPLIGFISKKGRAGRTFSITGSAPSGMSEMVFNKKVLSRKEVDAAVVGLIPEKMKEVPKINCNAIIAEGLKRFKKT